MISVEVIDSKKNKKGQIELKDEIFGVEIKKQLLHEVVVAQLAKRRRGTASTKGRSEVSGSRTKPWRQKGTGRARAGRNSSPIWVGGGITFGPKPRDYGFKVNKKKIRRAVRSALSMKLQEGKLVILEDWTAEEPKTKKVIQLLKDIGINDKALLVTPEKDTILKKSVNNIPRVKTLPARSLNVYDLLFYDSLILYKSSLPKIEGDYI